MFLNFPNIFQTNGKFNGNSYFYAMAKLAITYENWIKGKLELETAVSYSTVSGYKPKFTSIELFSVTDQKKIFEDQKAYFHSQVNKVYDEWMDEFSLRCAKSRELKTFISSRYKKIIRVLQGDVKFLLQVGVVVL